MGTRGTSDIWGAVATDFVTSGLQFYHSDPNDPDRVEKSIVAGGLHTVVTTTFAIGFAGLVTLIPGVGETGVAQLLAAGFGGWLGGKIADGVTNFANVTNITNTMNSWVSDASSLANNVGNKISDGVGTIVNAGGSVLNNIANVFSF